MSCRWSIFVLLFFLSTLGASGCYSPGTLQHASANVSDADPTLRDGLEPSHALAAVSAWVDPPIDWQIDKFDADAQHSHVVWLSPTRDTAYGIVMMNLPLPVSPEIVLWAFLGHMKAADRRADLLRQSSAPELPGLRFEAESGLYHIRVNLTVHNWRAWAVYAGTLIDKPENADELSLAEKARDQTRLIASTQPIAPR
jgi:hypothetical protein